MEITYHEENGYLIPNVIVGCDTTRPIGKYGRMRREYLREHRPVLFGLMVQNGTLFEHLQSPSGRSYLPGNHLRLKSNIYSFPR